ncbi:MAG: hypothetical protein QW156_03980 [Candidatus Aenigmatarchaeota archaeon]
MRLKFVVSIICCIESYITTGLGKQVSPKDRFIYGTFILYLWK